MKIKLFVLNFIFLSSIVFSQITQTVKGKIVDKVTGIGLPGAIVQLKSTDKNIVVTANNDGFYKLAEVPVGRQSFLYT